MTNPNGPDVSYSIPSGYDVAGSILGFAGQMYDSYQNRKVARENTDKTLAANKAESELAYQRSLEQWHMQNAYNTPEAQMQRFRQAGLNPHLIYGQGNAGNASSPSNYQPADMQHRYVAGQYGEAVASILPTLMSVGTWMQNMRLSEVDINKRMTETERAQAMVDFLLQQNPQLLKKTANELSLFPYQKDAQVAKSQGLNVSAENLMRQFELDWGEPSQQSYKQFSAKGRPDARGMKHIEMVRKQLENQIKSSESKLKGAQASWTEFGITSPQALMQMVLGAALGMAGKTLRAAPKVNPKNRRTGELPISKRRLHPARRVQRGN